MAAFKHEVCCSYLVDGEDGMEDGLAELDAFDARGGGGRGKKRREMERTR